MDKFITISRKDERVVLGCLKCTSCGNVVSNLRNVRLEFNNFEYGYKVANLCVSRKLVYLLRKPLSGSSGHMLELSFSFPCFTYAGRILLFSLAQSV